MPNTDKELTVEECLAELREIFPKRWITVTGTTHSARAQSVQVSWTISVDQLVDDFEGATLAGCIAQVHLNGVIKHEKPVVTGAREIESTSESESANAGGECLRSSGLSKDEREILSRNGLAGSREKP